MAIQGLPLLLSKFTSSTLLAVNENNQDYRCLPSTFKTWLDENYSNGSGMSTIYAAPTATAFSVPFVDGPLSQWLVLTPTAAFATGTLVLPAVANCVDGQELLVHCTQAVSLLTTNANGGSVSGQPTSLSAGSFFRLKFEPTLKRWYRVG